MGQASKVRVLRALLLSGAGAVFGMTAASAQAQAVEGQDGEVRAGQAKTSVGTPVDDGREIVVTARRRDERLLDVPVSVAALGEETLERYQSDNLASITETVPTVTIASYNTNGGGTISIRGIGTPASQGGFEQAVSLVIDGIPLSSARLVSLGYFDLDQVEVLKGPQALFFGKNSPAGVISLNSKDPTAYLSGEASASYEVVGDEAIVQSVLSGPLTDSISARGGVRFRHLEGWLYNDAGPIPDNPFNASAPIPGVDDDRVGEREFLGRLALSFENGGPFDAVLKVAGQILRTDGPSSQNIGPCPTSAPRVFAAGINVPDPFGECVPDNHLTNGAPPVQVGSKLIDYPEDGEPFTRSDALIVSLNANYTFNELTLASTTGYIYYTQKLFTGFDQTSFSSLLFSERDKSDQFSQELRLSSDFGGRFNFMVGGFFQTSTNPRSTDLQLNNSTNTGLPYPARCFNPANGSFSCYIKETDIDSETMSAFAQVSYRVLSNLELSGGLRYTHEAKDTFQVQTYGVGPFDVSDTVFPDSLSREPGTAQGRYRDDNLSPEITVTYNPSANSTIYAAYKTGFKSGGFGNSGPFTTGSTVAGISFGPETVEGFEIGAKGRFGPLRVEMTAFAYDFTDLQVNTFDASTITFRIDNAGKVVQRGFDIQADLQATDHLALRGTLAYTRNRFEDYVGQCYNYRYPAGTTRAQLGGAPAGTVAEAPSGCEFASPTVLTLIQDFDGRAPARSPDWAASAGFTFDQPVGTGYELTLNGDLLYSSGYFPGETMSPGTRQDPFVKLNASVRFAPAAGPWSVSLIGRNLTNEYVTVFAAERSNGLGVVLSPNENRGVVARGREVALRASYSF